MHLKLLAVLALLAGPALALNPDTQLRTDVHYWIDRYDGNDLVSGKFQCTPPMFPAFSRGAAEIRKFEQAHEAWRTCYAAFLENLRRHLPAGKYLPEDVAKRMTEQERAKALSHLSDTYDRIADTEAQRAEKAVAAYEAWKKATEHFMMVENKRPDERPQRRPK